MQGQDCKYIRQGGIYDMTKRKIKEKEKVIIYGLSGEEKKTVENEYKEYRILDASGCFTDVLAIPAYAVIIDPRKLSDEEFGFMNEAFEYEKDICKPGECTRILFTADIDHHAKYSYKIWKHDSK